MSRGRENRKQSRIRLDAKLKQRLVALPRQFGFESAHEFSRAFRAAAGLNHRRVAQKKRVRLTPEVAAKLRRLTEEGHHSVVVARTLGVAPQTIHNWRCKLKLHVSSAALRGIMSNARSYRSLREEQAAKLGISRFAVYRWLASGRITEKELEKLVASTRAR